MNWYYKCGRCHRNTYLRQINCPSKGCVGCAIESSFTFTDDIAPEVICNRCYKKWEDLGCAIYEYNNIIKMNGDHAILYSYCWNCNKDDHLRHILCPSGGCGGCAIERQVPVISDFNPSVICNKCNRLWKDMDTIIDECSASLPVNNDNSLWFMTNF